MIKTSMTLSPKKKVKEQKKKLKTVKYLKMILIKKLILKTI